MTNGYSDYFHLGAIMNIGVTNFFVHNILVIIHVVLVGIHLGVAEP